MSIPPGDVRLNLELKARVRDWDLAHRIAGQVADGPAQVITQRDTYFVVPAGRLKLREFANQTAELIAYRRANAATSRESQYQIAPVHNPVALKSVLTASLGVWQVVEKSRHLYMRNCTRIHLDNVVGLGYFLEFEYVCPPGIAAETGRETLQELASMFAPALGERLAGSYSDLLKQNV